MSSSLPQIQNDSRLGYICSPAELQLASLKPTNFVCLTRSQSIGLSLATLSSFVSIVAASGVLFLICRRVYNKGSFDPMLMFLTSLFVSELLIGVGNVMDLKWVMDGKLSTGGFCTAQGATKQLGEMSVGLTTLSIAILNFVTIWWKKKSTKTVALIVIGIQWLFVILFVSIGFALHTRSNEYYATPIRFWCWLSARFNKERIAGEYFWLWLALFGSILLYLPLFCWYLGIITPDASRWYKPNPGEPAPSPDDASESEADDEQQSTTQSQSNTAGAERDQADEILHNHKDHDLPHLRQATQQRPELGATIWYPIVYCVIILPFSVVRWIPFVHHQAHIPDSATFATVFLFAFSGALNAVLYVLTRRRLLWGGSRPKNMQSAAHALFHPDTPSIPA